MRGFTLLELLLALGLAAVVIGLLMKLLESSLDLWKRSADRRELTELSSAVLELAAADLGALDGGERGDLLAEWERIEVDGNGIPQLPVQRLRFVRWSTPAELERLEPSRPAGPDSTALIGPGVRHDRVEVCWALLPLGTPRPGEPAEYVLWRGEQRLGQPDAVSFLAPQFFSKSGKPPTGVLEEVAGGVLWFEVLFAPQTADLSAGWKLGPGLAQCGASWDAWRRGRPDPERCGRNEPHPGVPEVIGRPALPRRARIAVEIERDADLRRRTKLSAELDLRGGALRVVNGERLPEPGTHVLVEEEWMLVSSVSGDEASVIRAQRSSLPAPHPVGALVRFGAPFAREVVISMHREEWGL